MRVSSSMIFDTGASGISRQTSALLKVQQQLSSGRRIVTPGDDPVAAARAMEVSQANDVVSQFARNQDTAIGVLGLEEAHLSHTEDLLLRVHQLALQAGSAIHSPTARKGIAVELRGTFDQLLGIANSKDAAGNHVFGGFKSDTVPFGGSIDPMISGGEIAYLGDEGQRELQVSASRFIPISDSGLDVFRRIPNGNGYFVTNYTAGNTGTATINAGTISDPSAWRNSATQNVAVKFSVNAGVTTYDLVDTVSGKSLLTGGAAPAAVGSQRAYLSGQPIDLKSQGAEPAFNLGGSIAISGTPANGDSYALAPSSSQSVFSSVAKLVGALENGGTTPADDARYLSDIQSGISNIRQSLDNVVRLRAEVGTRMNEIDSLKTMGGELSLQYQQSLSELQDVDYAKTITEMTRRQASLEAAQQSFLRISQLSLFRLL
jgi:flagellar hook-associated protein 3 FlgL